MELDDMNRLADMVADRVVERLTKKPVQRSRVSQPLDVLEVEAYARELGYEDFDAAKFFNHYAAKGWMMGKQPMKSWKHAVAGARSWCILETKTTNGSNLKF